MTSMHKRASTQASIRNILDAIGRTEKAADDGSDPGSIGGKSTHPTASADGNTQDAPEGFRSRENASDVKEQVPASVDAAPDSGASSKTQEDLADNIGMTATTTGKTPEVETSSAKSTKDDPGTSHPADTENSSLNGGKYSADLNLLSKQVKLANDLGIDLVAGLTLEFSEAVKVKQAADKLAEDKAAAEKIAAAREAAEKKAAEEKPAQTNDKEAAEAGYDLAGVLAGIEGLTVEDKQAADHQVVDSVFRVVKVASEDADRVIEFYVNRLAAQQKQAQAQAQAKAGRKSKKRAEEGGNSSGASEVEEDDDDDYEGGGGGGEEADMGDAGDVGGEEDLLAMLEGGGMGGGMGGGDVGGEMGGMGDGADILGAMAGGAGGGGEMGGGMGGEMGGGMAGGPPMADPAAGGGLGGSPEDLAMLQEILAKLNIPPEALEAAAIGKAAADIRAFRGNQKVASAPKTKAKVNVKSARYQQMLNTVTEIMDRGRPRR